MNRPGLLLIEGKAASTDITLNLKDGWSLVGYIPPNICYANPKMAKEMICPYKEGVYKPEEEITLCHINSFPDSLFSSIAGKYRRIIAFDTCNGSMIYDTGLPEFINTLHYIGPKYGFWIKMNEPGILSFPAGCSGQNPN